MYSVRMYAEVEIDEFASDVIESLKEFGSLKQGDESKLRERLIRVLDLEPFSVAAKAVLLWLEHEHRYCNSRILTDTRPVFGSDAKAAPVAMMIGHTLRVLYHDNDATREIYIALRPHDLDDLGSQIERAIEKENSLRASLEAARFKVIESQED